MALFDNMPYTNLHEINLDWIIQQIKNYTATVDGYSSRIETIEQEAAELKEYINERLTDLGVAEDVSEIIDAMITDGTLEEMLKRTIPMRTATIERYARILDRFTDAGLTAPRLYMQAVCYHEHKYYFCGNKNAENTEQSISVWGETGELLASQDYTTLSHASDICYLNGKLYVVAYNRVAVINAETLAIESYINKSSNINSTTSICTDGIYLYITGTMSGQMFGIDKYDPATGVTLNITNNLTFSGVRQASEYHAGYIYYVYNAPNAVVKVNATTGVIEQVYMLPVNDGYYWTGEPEKPFMKDGVLCIMSVIPYANAGYGTSTYAQLFQTDIVSIFKPVFPYTSPAVTPKLLLVNGNAATELNPTVNFTVPEELNAIVPDIPISLSNVQHGYVSRPHASTLSIRRTSGNGHLSRLEIYQGTALLNFITVDDLFAENTDVIIKLGSVSNANCRMSRVTLDGVTFSDATNLERTALIAGDSAVLNITGTPVITNMSLDAEARYPSTAQLITTINNMRAFLANAGTRRIVFSIDVTAGNDVVHFVRGLRISDMAATLTMTNGEYTLTITDTTVTFTKSGASVTIGSFENMRFQL